MLGRICLIVFISSVCGFWSLVSAALRQADAVPATWECDFESTESARHWTTTNGATAERRQVGNPNLRTANVAKIISPAGGVLLTKPELLPADLLNFTTLELQVYRPASAPPLVLDLLFLPDESRPAFHRQVSMMEAGWKTIAVPLRLFAPGQGGIPRWSEIRRFAIACPNDSTFYLARVRLLPAVRPRTEDVSPSELKAVAFPQTTDRQVREVVRQHVVLMTDCDALDLSALAEHLAGVEEALRRRLPFLSQPENPPLLAVFAREEDFRRAVQNLAELRGGNPKRPIADGMTLFGCALSTWDATKGSLRSVYTHEYVHAWLERGARIPNRGDWIQEGLATFFQAEMHPEVSLPHLARTHWANARPLQEICSGQPLRREQYWQAASLWECLLIHPTFQPRLKDLLEAIRTSENLSIAPHLQPVLGITMGDLTSTWKLHCISAYGVR